MVLKGGGNDDILEATKDGEGFVVMDIRLYNARCMFDNACAFVECADYCENEQKKFAEDITSFVTVGIINANLACEFFVKSLLLFHGNTLEEIKGQKLKPLWQKYKSIDVDNAIKIEKSIQQVFKSSNDNFFDEMLECVSGEIDYWCGFYSKGGPVASQYFLQVFRNLLRQHCCQTLYDKTWLEWAVQRKKISKFER